MTSQYYLSTYPYTENQQCPSCGAWYVGYHTCWTAPYNTPPSYPTYIYPTDLTPVLEKLDELLKEIRKLNKQNNKLDK